MKEPPTYYNDNNIKQLIYTEVTDDTLLDFFFKKHGKVNINNLQYVVHEYGKKQIAQNLVNLEAKGLIKSKKGFLWVVTTKARWQRFYSHPTWTFWTVVLTVVGIIIALIALRRT